MNDQAAALLVIRKRCESAIREVRELLDIIERHLHVPGLARRIDTFFYIEANSQFLRILNNLDYCWEVDDGLLIKMAEIQQLVRTQWQRDYMYICCPVSLHPYLD